MGTAYKRLPEGMVPEVKDFGLMKTIDENGISRYWTKSNEKDDLINTPEFDILGIIVYD